MNIDPSIINLAADSGLRHYQLGDWPHEKDLGRLRNDILIFAIWSLWDRILIKMNAYGPGTAVCNAEAAVAACMRKGLLREDIIVAGDTLIIRLKYGGYMITKHQSGFSAMLSYPRPCGQYGGVLFIEPDVFADFLYSFDESIPTLGKVMDDRIMPEVSKIRLQREKEEMVSCLIDSQVNALVQEYLDPLDIRCAYSVNDGDVAMTLTMDFYKKMAILTVPLGKLAETFRDTKGLLSRFVPIKEKDSRNRFSWPENDQCSLVIK